MTSKLATIIALLFTVITHELAHGYVALWNGDPTAKRAGRLSPNPLKHIDPLGTLFLIIFKFGWAKPVPINSYYFRNKRLGLFTVSIAGVTVNILTAFIATFIFYLLPESAPEFLFELIRMIAIYGVVFAVFNLIPIPPLDGSKLVASFMPVKFQYYIYKYEKYFFILLVILLGLNIIGKKIMPLTIKILAFFETIVRKILW